MDLDKAKKVLYDLTKMFFQNATVIWAEQTITKPKLPYVTLKMKGVQRPRFPVTDAEQKRFYHASTILEINLYTQGEPVNVAQNAIVNYKNTAASDLNDFFLFLESEEITDQLVSNDIEVSIKTPVNDLSELLNDSSYRYRAMAEATVSFTMEAGGLYGLSGVALAPSASGGGSEELRDAELHVLEEAEIKEDYR